MTWFPSKYAFFTWQESPLEAGCSADDSSSYSDASEKPPHSYIALISLAILDCPDRKLVLSDIYQYIMDNFPYYNNQERAWRNSIRHNLSLNECFIKAGRAENGKGNYWSIHPACIDDFSKGDYRRRHARRRARGSAYSDININSLPFNYRCNLGYVPMTPSAVISYPYQLPYLQSLPSASQTLLRGLNMEAMASMASLVAQQHIQSSKQGSLKTASTNTDALSAASPQKTAMTSLLSSAPLPGLVSPAFQYSPYGFPYI